MDELSHLPDIDAKEGGFDVGGEEGGLDVGGEEEGGLDFDGEEGGVDVGGEEEGVWYPSLLNLFDSEGDDEERGGVDEGGSGGYPIVLLSDLSYLATSAEDGCDEKYAIGLDSAEHYSDVARLRSTMKAIGAHKGNLITLVIPSSIKINVVLYSLALEYDSTVDSEKRAAISVVQNKLKLYDEVPPNGLVLYCGTISGKEQEVAYAIEPPRAVKFCMYRYGNRFHTEALDELVQRKYGYVVVHAGGAVFGIAVGDKSKMLQTLSVDTPNKYGKILSSTRCFLKMRMETQDKLVNDTAKLAEDIFINPETNVPMIHHLIVVGSADLMPAMKYLVSALREPDLFDHRLERKILGVVGICNRPHDHEHMFGLAVRKTSTYRDETDLQETLLNRYIQYVKEDRCVCGLEDTLAAAQLGVVDTIFVWEHLRLFRLVLRNNNTGETIIKYQESNQSSFADEAAVLEVQEKRPVVDWLLSNYAQFGGCCIEIVRPGPPDEPVTPTVNAFCKGLHGIGAVLRMS